MLRRCRSIDDGVFSLDLGSCASTRLAEITTGCAPCAQGAHSHRAKTQTMPRSWGGLTARLAFVAPCRFKGDFEEFENKSLSSRVKHRLSHLVVLCEGVLSVFLGSRSSALPADGAVATASARLFLFATSVCAFSTGPGPVREISGREGEPPAPLALRARNPKINILFARYHDTRADSRHTGDCKVKPE